MGPGSTMSGRSTPTSMERVEVPSDEAQRFNDAIVEAKTLMLQAFELEMDLEMHRQIIVTMREYRAEFSRDQTRNLTRALIRMMMLTGETINQARGLGSSIEKLGGTVLEQVGAVAKIRDYYQPKQADQKSTVRSAVEGVGWSTFKETLESMGDPKSIVTTIATSTMEEEQPRRSAGVEDQRGGIPDTSRPALRQCKVLDSAMLETERDLASRRDLSRTGSGGTRSCHCRSRSSPCGRKGANPRAAD